MPSHARVTGLTYDDLEFFPDDRLRRELIGGELIETPPPYFRHQDVVAVLLARLGLYARERGGIVLSYLDVYFAHDDVVVPDVLAVLPEHRDRVEECFIRGAPDVIVEVSSPGTRNLELGRKRDLYERYGVPEYWHVDLEIDAVRVFRLVGGAYGDPVMLERGETLTSPLLPGFALGRRRAVRPLAGLRPGPTSRGRVGRRREVRRSLCAGYASYMTRIQHTRVAGATHGAGNPTRRT